MKKRPKRKAAPSKRLGRPPKAEQDKKRASTFTLAADVLAFLATTDNKSQTIETAIRRSKAFRNWLKARK